MIESLPVVKPDITDGKETYFLKEYPVWCRKKGWKCYFGRYPTNLHVTWIQGICRWKIKKMSNILFICASMNILRANQIIKLVPIPRDCKNKIWQFHLDENISFLYCLLLQYDFKYNTVLFWLLDDYIENDIRWRHKIYLYMNKLQWKLTD